VLCEAVARLLLPILRELNSDTRVELMRMLAVAKCRLRAILRSDFGPAALLQSGLFWGTPHRGLARLIVTCSSRAQHVHFAPECDSTLALPGISRPEKVRSRLNRQSFAPTAASSQGYSYAHDDRRQCHHRRLHSSDPPQAIHGCGKFP
jgi:hypothetical protein